MRKSLWLVVMSVVTTLAVSGCGSGRGPYVTATPSKTPKPSATPNPTRAAKLTRTAQASNAQSTPGAAGNARTMTARAKAKTRVAARTQTLTPVAATPTPQSAELPKIPDTPPTPPGFGTGSPPAMALGSGAFAPDGEIPVDYTCHGENTSPALDWSNLPQGTASLALTLTDPDSDPPGFVHWVAYEIQPQAGGLPPALPARDTLDDGILQGLNSFSATEDTAFPSGAAIHKVGYDGPCPPSAHRYVFTLYALDQTPGLGPRASLDQLLQAMEGHILATAHLQGRFAPPE